MARDASSVSFVVAVTDESRLGRCAGFLRRLRVEDLVILRGASSLFEAYDEGWRRAANEAVAFVHEDVDLEALDASMVAAHLNDNRTGFLGAAGSRVLGRSAVWWQWRSWQGAPMLSGRVGHRSAEGDRTTDYGPCGEVVVLDGLLLITTKRVLAAIGGFHDPPLAGFDFYDLSATLRAHLSGYANRTIPVGLFHWSVGSARPGAWEANRRAFAAKYGDRLPCGVGMQLTAADDPQEMMRSAIALHQQGEATAAIAAYESVLASEPSNVAAIANLASALRHLGRADEAVARYRSAVALDDGVPQIWFNFGNLLHQSGNAGEAERCYRRALDLDPDMAAAHFNLGNLLRDADRPGEAEAEYRRSIECDPSCASVHTNLGNLLRVSGRATEAAAAHRRALALDGENADVHVKLANALMDAGQHRAAAARYRQALRRRPDHPATLVALGDALAALGRRPAARQAYMRAASLDRGSIPATLGLVRGHEAADELDEAEELLRRALELHRQEPRLLRALARLLQRRRRLEEAIRIYERLARTAPEHADTHYALGVALHDAGRVAEARARLQRSVDLDPEHVAARVRLGTVLRALDRHQEAIEQLTAAVRLAPDDPLPGASLALALAWVARHTEALAIARKMAERHPDSADALMVTGYCLTQQGRIGEALAAFDEAGKLRPDHRMVISNTLFTTLYSDRHGAHEVAAVHRELAQRLEHQAGPRAEVHPDPDPARRLRIGYVSPDFRNHPVGYFMEPILANHWPERFDIVCYSDTAMRDDVNQRLRSLPVSWCDTAGWDDDRLGSRIVDDRIDILVDLAGHTAANRARLFAYKPAPIQALYLGYPYTSGLSTMDYLIADATVIPPEDETLYSEQVVRLDGCFLSFRPQPGTPEVSEPPIMANGHVTFGSFNTLAKLSPTTMSLWARVLGKLPQARLVLKCQALLDGGTRAHVLRTLEAQGVDGARVVLTHPLQPLSRYLAAYGQIDIVLDTVPYNGGTTTCDALWMGVPVVTLAGDHFYGRMGTSILDCVGLEALVARTSDEYVDTAVALAGDAERLRALRAGMRERLFSSSLCDDYAFTQRLEGAYRAMWHRWCEGQ